MTCTVLVDGKKLMLNPFMTTLTGNIIDAVARSLKSPEGKRFEFQLEHEQLRFFVDGTEVPLNLGHGQQIIGSILKGLVQSMHGAESGKLFQFIYEHDVRS